MRFFAEHQLLFQVLAGLAAAILAPSVAWFALRPRKPVVGGRHHSGLTADDRPYTARHAVPYHAHHAATAAGSSAYLGRSPDGDTILVDDEHTHELIGAAA